MQKQQGRRDVRARTILVVDDEPSMRFLLRVILEPEGYAVVEAKHGAEALERVRERRPDLVVTDLTMPVMSGTELIAGLRADPETASIPIVVISGDDERAATPCDAVLGKPFDHETLLDSLSLSLRKAAAAARSRPWA